MANPKRPFLRCGYSHVSHVFDSYPYVARSRLGGLDLVLIGRYRTVEGVDPQCRCSYVARTSDCKRLPSEQRLKVLVSRCGEMIFSVDVLEVPLRSVIKMWMQVNGHDLHDHYGYVAVEESGLVPLTWAEYCARAPTFDVHIPEEANGAS